MTNLSDSQEIPGVFEPEVSASRRPSPSPPYLTPMLLDLTPKRSLSPNQNPHSFSCQIMKKALEHWTPKKEKAQFDTEVDRYQPRKKVKGGIFFFLFFEGRDKRAFL